MKNGWLLFLAVAAVAVCALWLRGGSGDGWSSESPEAIAEFELCREADMKFYARDAVEHCQRAVELDPNFIVAKLRLIQGLEYEDKRDRAKLIQEVRDADRSRLSDRERFLVEHRLARLDDRPGEMEKILEEYLGDHPDDPFALSYRCGGYWEAQDWPRATPCYQRLIKVDPNWVVAQNRLGYIAMAQGKFSQAEELLETYRFIAPDQANPHDSFGELLSLVGRYDEAKEAFLKALKIRSDFCASYMHLVTVFLLEGDPASAATTVEKMESQGQCDGRLRVMLDCQAKIWNEILVEDWDGAWEVAENGCMLGGDVELMAHLAAVMSGREEEALFIEQEIEAGIERAETGRGEEVDKMMAALFHVQGIRAAASGDFDAASERLALADSKLKYWHETGLSIFKLYNRLNLAAAKRRNGESVEAEAIEEEVRSVNPKFRTEFGPLLGS